VTQRRMEAAGAVRGVQRHEPLTVPHVRAGTYPIIARRVNHTFDLAHHTTCPSFYVSPSAQPARLGHNSPEDITQYTFNFIRMNIL